MHQAVIFDMDGVLIDSEPVFRVAAQRASSALGHTITDEFYAELIGLPNAEIAAALVAAFGPSFSLDDFRGAFEQNFRRHVAAHGLAQKPGARDILVELSSREIPRAVATSTRSPHAQYSLRVAGLIELLPIVVTGDQVTRGKPAPDIFVRAADLVGTEPAACIAVEDSSVGARAAVAAGMFTILVPDLKQPDAELAELVDVVVPDMPAAGALIRQMLAL